MFSNITNLNNFCNEQEKFLSAGAAIPVIGVAFGGAKMMFGTQQAIIALALGIISLPFRCCCDEATTFNDHCWSHVVHGLGNIVGGLGEALLSITIIGGLILFGVRKCGHLNGNPYHQDKYIPYSNLIALDIAALPANYQARDELDTSTPSKLFSPTAFRNAIGINVVPIL